MPTTKYKIAEQVLVLLQGGDPKQASGVELPDIIELVGQVANRRLKLTHFQETMQAGERIPQGLMLATYEGIPVTQYAGRARVVLPAVPLALPRGVGVFQVVPIVNGAPQWDCEWIPVPAGQLWMIQKEGLLSDLMGHVGYEHYGIELLATKDVTTMTPAVTSVLLRLAVVDTTRLTDHDLLPVPADMEADIITDVFNILTNQKPKLNVVDPTAQPAGGNA